MKIGVIQNLKPVITTTLVWGMQCLVLAVTLVLMLSFIAPSGFASTGKLSDVLKDAQSSELPDADKLHAQVVELFREKRFKEALPLAKSVVETREKALGLANEKTIASLKNLASIYSELDKDGDAAKIRERVLKAEETLYGLSSIKLCDNLSRLGFARMKDDKLSGAIEAFKRNLQIRETVFGLESKELAQTLNDLAMLSQRDGNLSQSIAYFKRLILIKEKEIGANHPDVAELLAKCAIILGMANKKKEANEYEARARAIYAALPDQQVPETIAPDVLQGVAILKVAPEYPMSAKSNRVRGVVQVQVLIDEIGSVTKATAISGPNELKTASETAAKQWRFKPTMVNGKPIKVQGFLTFNFTLQ